ncbi:MAG: hypothetical protein CBC91_00140 [Rickettsiales bacterium TMED131]|nr:MAG: hypothetical protein CBC91_00140 [Rickettsiales bacterium TMED131]
MANLRQLQLNLAVGQEIAVGKHDDIAKITKIEYFPKSGDVSINTTRGPRKALTFRILESSNEDSYECTADKYR